MPTTKELDERLRAVELALAEARGGKRAWLSILSVATAVAIALTSWTLMTIHGLGIQVAALNTFVTQQLPKVALSNVGQDPQEAVRSYDFAKAALQNTKLDHGHKSRDASLLELGQTLAKQEPVHGQLIQYWQLASVLIDTRSKISVPERTPALPDCLAKEWSSGGWFQDPQSGKWQHGFPIGIPRETLKLQFSNCRLQLDDPHFEESAVGKKISGDSGHLPLGVVADFDLENVFVTYGGGGIIPVRSISMTNCRFQLAFPTIPAKPVRAIALALLQSDLERVSVSVRS